MTRAFFKVLRWLPCLLFALAATSAFAHCRPENRVWGFSEKTADFASQESENPIAASGENTGCGYDFASGVHKYLYCQGNPVNGSDPGGHDELADVSLAGAEGAAIDAEAMPVLSKVYMTTYNALMKVAMNQQQILFYANATLAAATAMAAGAEVMDRAAQRLLKNTAPIPAGNWTYGQQLEQTALQGEQGYLGGTVSKIDYFDRNNQFALSFKAHGLSSSIPNLSDRLLTAIQRDLQKMSAVKVTGAYGRTLGGVDVAIAGSDIKQMALAVAVPESQAATVLSSTFQRMLVTYEEFYETEIEVIPVQGWMR